MFRYEKPESVPELHQCLNLCDSISVLIFITMNQRIAGSLPVIGRHVAILYSDLEKSSYTAIDPVRKQIFKTSNSDR